jgi:hypothetical protein
VPSVCARITQEISKRLKRTPDPFCAAWRGQAERMAVAWRTKMRKRIFAFVIASAILAGSARAHEASKHRAATVTGEIVDTGCFLGHRGQGAKHVGCATKCINGGMPMGVLTRQGTLYLVTMNHDNPDPYNKLKGMAGKSVAVTGQSYTRAGMKAIEVTGFKPARGA